MRKEDIVRSFAEVIRSANKKKTSSYDTTAKVVRVEGDVAWVHIPGGVDETPVKKTIACKAGDEIQVRVGGGRAWIGGNATAPPTDDTKADIAQVTAVEAKEVASDAIDYATTAQEAADSAVQSAEVAHQAADKSLTQLSIVEDVSGTLTWIRDHGEYVATTDTEVVPGRVYFEMVSGDFVPIPNPDPSANPSERGWYVLDITDSQTEYIMAHLAVTAAGLWVLPNGIGSGADMEDSDGNTLVTDGGDILQTVVNNPQTATGYKVLLSNSGMTVFDDEGNAVASYSDVIVLGELSKSHARIDYHSLQLVDKEGSAYFYVSDLRGQNGRVTITETLVADGNSQYIQLQVEAVDTSYSVKVNGVEKETGVHKRTTELTVSNISVGDVITVEYESESTYAKAYTAGKREAESVPGLMSFAEGSNVNASGYASHAEGRSTEASGRQSHAEGQLTAARGRASHAGGQGTEANYANQTAIGQYNDNDPNNIFEVGIGANDTHRKNGFSVDYNGTIKCAGTIKSPGLQKGTISVSNIQPHSYADYEVTFAETFFDIPVVVAGLYSKSTGAGSGSIAVGVHTISAFGFTARVFNDDDAVRSPDVEWIAMA